MEHDSDLVPEDQTPPEGYEPQTELADGQKPTMQVRPPDEAADAEAEEADVEGDGDDADDGDDDAVDDDAVDDSDDA